MLVTIICLFCSVGHLSRNYRTLNRISTPLLQALWREVSQSCIRTEIRNFLHGSPCNREGVCSGRIEGDTANGRKDSCKFWVTKSLRHLWMHCITCDRWRSYSGWKESFGQILKGQRCHSNRLFFSPQEEKKNKINSVA